MARPLATLPKAHLHLHFTGSMRHTTLADLAQLHRIHLPEALVADWPPRLSAADERGWFRFQRLYDIARSAVRTEADVRRLLVEAAQDERADGSRWLEIQVDPSGYAGRFGGLTPLLELVLDTAADAAAMTGVGIGIIVAANRTKHPLEARTLARLAASYADRGVTGFGLSNDERRGTTRDFIPAFRIARRAGLCSVPHGGELCGPASVRACLDDLHADRIGHGVAAARADVPLLRLYNAGVPIALGADDPLLFGPRLTAQYEIARQVHGMSDPQLAELARMSVTGSAAPAPVRSATLAGIDAWLATDEQDAAAQPTAVRA